MAAGRGGDDMLAMCWPRRHVPERVNGLVGSYTGGEVPRHVGQWIENEAKAHEGEVAWKRHAWSKRKRTSI